jgi:hypothetical protein
MHTSTSDRLTRATTEQLLDGGSGPAGLHQLLAAAAGPGTASELAGETAAVAAFVDAPRASPLPSAPIRRPSMLSTALSKILAAKALAAMVLLAGAGGGVALATTVSDLPSSPPADQQAVTSTPTGSPAPSDDREPGSGRAADGGPDRATSPQPSLAGLCNAWAAGATDNPGAAADNPAFGSLVEAAGSPEKVPGYCADLPDADRPGRSGAAPGHDGEEPDGPPADRPGGAANRGGPPTAAPGNPDHPAGPPAGRADKGADPRDGDASDGDAKEKGNPDNPDKDTRSKPDDQGGNDKSPAAGGRSNN